MSVAKRSTDVSGYSTQTVVPMGRDVSKRAATPLLRAARTTYTMAQKASFLDDCHYAIGRWDGSLGLFAFADSSSQKPVVARMIADPALDGIQMIVPLENEPAAFVSSGGFATMIVWTSESGKWTDLQAANTLAYDSELGAANSGTLLLLGSSAFLVVGHANGFISIWERGQHIADWRHIRTTDIRSKAPVNPWQLFNVRGISAHSVFQNEGVVIAGSEDGNLTVLRVPDGAILSTKLYNPKASRGINSLAIQNSFLLVANCSVGPDDFNLWSYQVDPETWNIEMRDRANLCLHSFAPQVFNFDVVFASREGSDLWFFSSTGEGVLWTGRLSDDGRIGIAGHQSIGPALGSALCFRNGRLAVTAYDLHEFVVWPESGAE
ncbi:protein of unknown function [Hyphomicrobium sp. MC1]|nr:protein of unknown function [Hyphomicrobium sp. MC1]